MIRRSVDRWGFAGSIAGLLISILTICGLVYAGVSRCAEWDKIKVIEPQVWKNKEDLQGVRLSMAVINAQYQNIHEDLAYLKMKSKE